MICIIISLWTLAGWARGGDPIVVWPSDMSHERIEARDIIGSWWAVSSNDFAEVIIRKTKNKGQVQFLLKRASEEQWIRGALTSIQADGFLGAVKGPEGLVSTEALIYWSALGLRLQLSSGTLVESFDLLRQEKAR
ncbi:MAG: hypothetical protein AAGB31_10325 [Bdellovibrio sp.]